MFPVLPAARPATASPDPKLVCVAGSSVAPAPRPTPVSPSDAVLLSALVTVSGVDRAPGTAGVKLEVSRQSEVESEFVAQTGVESDHSLELIARPFVAASVSLGIKCKSMDWFVVFAVAVADDARPVITLRMRAFI